MGDLYLEKRSPYWKEKPEKSPALAEPFLK